MSCFSSAGVSARKLKRAERLTTRRHWDGPRRGRNVWTRHKHRITIGLYSSYSVSCRFADSTSLFSLVHAAVPCFTASSISVELIGLLTPLLGFGAHRSLLNQLSPGLLDNKVSGSSAYNVFLLEQDGKLKPKIAKKTYQKPFI
jgi:hypothetical protein